LEDEPEEEDVDDKMAMNTIMQKPLPTMPHRMKSNFTFQPKSDKV